LSIEAITTADLGEKHMAVWNDKRPKAPRDGPLTLLIAGCVVFAGFAVARYLSAVWW
jgi:hypothetical protein